MKAYTHEVDQREVVLDLNIRWGRPIPTSEQFPSFQVNFVLSDHCEVKARAQWVYSQSLQVSTAHFAVMRVMWTSTPW